MSSYFEDSCPEIRKEEQESPWEGQGIEESCFSANTTQFVFSFTSQLLLFLTPSFFSRVTLADAWLIGSSCPMRNPDHVPTANSQKTKCYFGSDHRFVPSDQPFFARYPPRVLSAIAKLRAGTHGTPIKSWPHSSPGLCRVNDSSQSAWDLPSFKTESLMSQDPPQFWTDWDSQSHQGCEWDGSRWSSGSTESCRHRQHVSGSQGMGKSAFLSPDGGRKNSYDFSGGENLEITCEKSKLCIQVFFDLETL